MHVWNVQHAARWKYRMQKIVICHHRTTLSGYIFATKARIDGRKKNLLKSSISPIYPYNMVNFGPLTAGIRWRVWDTPANFNGFRVLALLLHGTLGVGVSQSLWHWTEVTTYVGRLAITFGIGPHSSLDLVLISIFCLVCSVFICVLWQTIYNILIWWFLCILSWYLPFPPNATVFLPFHASAVLWASRLWAMQVRNLTEFLKSQKPNK